MYIITDVYSLLGCWNIEGIWIIHTDLIQKDIVKQKHQLLLCNTRYFPHQKFFLFEKEFCNCWPNGNWEILCEIRHSFQQRSLSIFFWGHWLKEFYFAGKKNQSTEDLVQRIKDADTLALFSSLSSQVCETAKEISSYSGIYIPLLRYNLIDEGRALCCLNLGRRPEFGFLQVVRPRDWPPRKTVLAQF